MATVGLNNEQTSIITENDNIVIVENWGTIPGGRALNVTGDNIEDVLKAGHVIIRNTTTKEYKLMPKASASTYDALPAGHEYAGFLVASILKTKPAAGIMYHGTINVAASPYSLAGILAALKTALPQIKFLED